MSAPVHAFETCDLTDYQAGQRPDSNAATQVHLGLTIVDLMSIDDLDQTVTLDAVMHLRWHDPRLADKVGCRYPMQQLWHPDIQLVNSGQFSSRQPPELVVGEQGWLEGGVRLSGSIANPRSMADFPFDSHTIELDITSLRYAANEVQFQVDEKWSNRRAELTIPDWTIGKVSAQVEAISLPQIGRIASTYQFQIPASRMPRYYIYKIILPLMMIVLMSWAVFWVDPKSLGPQMALAATSMLTLITFQFTMNDLLPRISYFTQLDQFILGSSVLVFLALAEAVSTGYLASRGNDRIPYILDRVSRIAFPLTFVIIVLLTLVLEA